MDKEVTDKPAWGVGIRSSPTGDIIDDDNDTDFWNAVRDLQESRSQIEEAAEKYIKSKEIIGLFSSQQMLVKHLTDFAMQEIAEFIGLNAGDESSV